MEEDLLTKQFEFIKFPKPVRIEKDRRDIGWSKIKDKAVRKYQAKKRAKYKRVVGQGAKKGVKSVLTLKKLKSLYNKVKKYDTDRTMIWVKAKKKKSKPVLHKIKQIPLKDLVHKADKVFSKWIINRDGNKCVTPDSKCKSYLQASHLIKRGRKLTRWEESNVHSQCQHHNYNHDQGFHPSPEILTNYVINKYGIKEYNRLFKLSKADAPSSWVRAKAIEVINKYGKK